MSKEIKLTENQEQKIIASVKKKIINMLLIIPSNSISDGYYGWRVKSYIDFIWQFASLNILEKEFVRLAAESLVEKGFIEVGEGNSYKDAYIRLNKQYYASKI